MLMAYNHQNLQYRWHSEYRAMAMRYSVMNLCRAYALPDPVTYRFTQKVSVQFFL